MAKGTSKEIEQDTEQAEGPPLDLRHAQDTRDVQSTKDVQDVVSADEPAAAAPPTKPELLDDQSLALGIPETEEPLSDDNSLSNDTNMGIDDPSVDRDDVDPFELGLDSDSTFGADVEEALEAAPGFGGADGRNPASDSGGLTSPPQTSGDESGSRMPTEYNLDERTNFMGGNPHAGAGFLDGAAAGKLPPHQQAILDSYNEAAQRAAAAGDHDGVAEIADQTHEFLVDIGQSEPPAETGGSITAPLTFTEGEGVKSLPGAKAIQEKYKGTPFETASENVTGTGTNTTKGKALDDVMKVLDELGSGSTGTTPPAEDREQEFDGPDVHGGFIDEYFGLKTEAELGADINPGPNDDPGTDQDGYVSSDSEPFVAEYAEGHTEPTEEDLEKAMERGGPPIEWEFFDV